MIRKRARITRQMNASFSARGMTPKMTITECGKITPLREARRILTCAAEGKRTRTEKSLGQRAKSHFLAAAAARRVRDSIFDNFVFTAAWADGPRGLICAHLMTILNGCELISQRAAKRSQHYWRIAFFWLMSSDCDASIIMKLYSQFRRKNYNAPFDDKYTALMMNDHNNRNTN
jgi:hypothetical protein